MFANLTAPIARQLDIEATIHLAGVNRHWRTALRADGDRLGRALLLRRLARGELAFTLPELPARHGLWQEPYAAFVQGERKLVFFCNLTRTSTTFDLGPPRDVADAAPPSAPPVRGEPTAASPVPYAVDVKRVGVSSLGRYVWQISTEATGRRLALCQADAWTPSATPHLLRVNGSAVTLRSFKEPYFLGENRHCIAFTEDFGLRMWTLEKTRSAKGDAFSATNSVELTLPFFQDYAPWILHAELARDGSAMTFMVSEEGNSYPNNTVFLLSPDVDDAGIWRLRRRIPGLKTAYFGPNADQLVTVGNPVRYGSPPGSIFAFERAEHNRDTLMLYQVQRNEFTLLLPEVFSRPRYSSRIDFLRPSPDGRYAPFSHDRHTTSLFDLQKLSAVKLGTNFRFESKFAATSRRLAVRNPYAQAVAFEDLNAPTPTAVSYTAAGDCDGRPEPTLETLSRSGRVVALIRGKDKLCRSLHVGALDYATEAALF